MERKPKVLFLSRGNCSRSGMAEGFLRKWSKGEIEAVSTATESEEVSSIAREVMNEVGVDISRQQPRSLRESLKEHYPYVVSLYDSRRERFAIFPFTANLLRWNLKDATEDAASPQEERAAYRYVRDDLEVKVHDLLIRTLYPAMASWSVERTNQKAS